MHSIKALVTAGVCCVALTAAAHAADMPQLPPLQKPIYADLVSGWYVRVDTAYRWQDFGSINAVPPDVVTTWSIRGTPTIGGGGGYKFQWFRADVTFDYGLSARFDADTAAAVSLYSAKLDSFTILANVYFDLGTWWGFTPYVGAGLGGTSLRINEYLKFSTIPVPASTKWNLSWAAMAGVAYQITPRLVLDVGYRYLSMGDILSGSEPPLYLARAEYTDVTAQEARLGFRWVLD